MPAPRELCGLIDLVNGCAAHRHGLFAEAARGLEGWAFRAWHWAIVWTGLAR